MQHWRAWITVYSDSKQGCLNGTANRCRKKYFFFFLLKNLEYWIAIKVRRIKAWSEGCKKAFVHCAIYCLRIDVVNYYEWMPLLYPTIESTTTVVAAVAPTVSKSNQIEYEIFQNLKCILACCVFVCYSLHVIILDSVARPIMPFKTIN